MIDWIWNVWDKVNESVKDTKINLKRREHFDVITNLQVICCDVIKNVNDISFETIIDVKDSNLIFFVWCSLICWCNFVLLKYLIE